MASCDLDIKLAHVPTTPAHSAHQQPGTDTRLPQLWSEHTLIIILAETLGKQETIFESNCIMYTLLSFYSDSLNFVTNSQSKAKARFQCLCSICWMAVICTATINLPKNKFEYEKCFMHYKFRMVHTIWLEGVKLPRLGAAQCATKSLPMTEFIYIFIE